MKVEGLGVLHWVNYQGDDLEHSSQGQEASNHSQEDKHLGSAEGKEGEDEADHQDDKAAEEHGSSGSSPRCEERETAINKTDRPNLASLINVTIRFFSLC